MDAACYHSGGVDTAMLYNGTTLNKALLLDWPGTLCVHLLDLLQSYKHVPQYFLSLFIVLVCIGPVMYVWEGQCPVC